MGRVAFLSWLPSDPCEESKVQTRNSTSEFRPTGPLPHRGHPGYEARGGGQHFIAPMSEQSTGAKRKQVEEWVFWAGAPLMVGTRELSGWW